MRRQLLAGAVALWLLTAGCTSSDGGASGQRVAPKKKPKPVLVRSGAGLVPVGPTLVERPAGLSDLRVTPQVQARPGFVPDGLTASGTPVNLTVGSGGPTGPVRVGFPIPKGVDAATVLVATLVDGAWVPQPATYDAQRQAMVAPSDHLGWWTALTGPAGKYTGGLVQAIRDLTSTADIGAPPDCGPTPLPPKTVDLQLTDVNGQPSGVAARVDACALSDQGQTKVRLANRRPVAIALDLAAGVTRTGGTLPAAGPQATEILAGIDQRFGSPSTVIVPPGGTVELTVPAGPTTVIGHVDTKVLAWSLLIGAAAHVPGGWDGLAKLASTPGLLPGNTPLAKTDLLHEALNDFLAELAPGGTKLNQSVVNALSASALLEANQVVAGVQPGSGLTMTVTAPEGDQPAPPGTVCGPVQAGGQPVLVTVAKGAVGCPGAIGIVDTYLNHPPAPPDPTTGFVQVGSWSCVSTPAPGAGPTGSCTGPNDGLITFAGAKVAVDPTTWQITTDGVGPLRIGMTKDDVKALGINVTPQPLTCHPEDPDASVDGTAAVAWERASLPISVLFVTDPRISTPNGIHVGSTIDQVRAAYPGIPNFPDTGGQNPGYLVDGINGTGGEVYFHIDATSQDVDEIAVAMATPDRKPLVKLHGCS